MFRLLTFCYLFWLGSQVIASPKKNSAYTEPDSVYNQLIDDYAKAGVASLKKLIAQNEANNKEGKSAQNKYVFGFEPFFDTQSGKPFAKIVPNDKQGIINLEKVEQDLNSLLRKINDTLPVNKPKIYVGLEGFLGDVLIKTAVKNLASVSDFKGDNMADKNRSITQTSAVYDAIYTKIAGDNTLESSSTGMLIIGYGLFNELKTLVNVNGSSELLVGIGQYSNFKGNGTNGVTVANAIYKSVFSGQFSPFASSIEASSISNKLSNFAQRLADAMSGALDADDSGLTGPGLKFFQDCKKATGPFYGRGGKKLDVGLVRNISKQLMAMMDEGTYKKFIQSHIITYATLQELTDDDLKAFQQSLDQYKEAQEILFGFANNDNINALFDLFTIDVAYSCSPQNGLVPQKLWDNSLVSAPPAFSLPFAAGMIDEFATSIKSIASLPGVLWDFTQFINCWNPSPVSWFNPDCAKTRAKSVETLQFLAPFIPTLSNPAGPGLALTNVWIASGLTQADVENWFQDIVNKPKCTHYQLGKLTFFVASFFVVIGEIEGAAWLGKLGPSLKAFKTLLSTKFPRYTNPFISRFAPLKDAAGKALVEAKALINGTEKTIGKLHPNSQGKVMSFKPEPVGAKNITLNSRLDTPIEGSLALKPTFALATEEAAPDALQQALRVVNTLDDAEVVAEDVVVVVQKASAPLPPNTTPFVRVLKKEQLVNGQPYILLMGQNESRTQTAVLVAIAVATRVAYELKQEETPCTICTARKPTPSLCTNLQTLATRGNNRPAVERLCTNLLTTLESVVSRLLLLQDTEIQAFLRDIESPCGGSAYLCGNISSLTVEMVEAWKMVYEARCLGVANCNENVKKDWSVLIQVKSMLQDNAVLTALGNKAGLVEILQKNERTPCNTCGSGGASYLNKMDVYLKDVEYFVENYQGISGWNTVIGSQGIKNGGIHQVEATAFMLRVLHENPVEFESQVSGFEVLTGVGKRKMDIQKHSGTNVECKSWDDNADTFADFVAGTSNSYQQFLAYLQVVPDLTKLEYWLDGRKLTGATNADKLMTAKLKFQTLFQNKASEIFKEPINGGIGLAKCQQLFQIIDISDFLTKVSNTSSSIYTFIKVK
ncbi:MAG: hypothetical protein U0Y10_01460 [Spirosomataceae bacterium]